MTLKKTIVALSLLASTAARAQIWSPISPTDSGVNFVTHVNQSHNAVRPIEPGLSCYPFSFLPAVIKNHQVIACHHCATTNPCSTGTNELLAMGVCDDNGANCQWNCNATAPTNIGGSCCTVGASRVFSQAVLVNDALLHDTETAVLYQSLPLGNSPTGGWWVHYHASMLVQPTGTVQCDLRLYVDAPGTAQRVASTNGASAVTVTLDFDKFQANGATTQIDVRGIGSVDNTCTVLAATGITASVSASRFEVLATPK